MHPLPRAALHLIKAKKVKKTDRCRMKSLSGGSYSSIHPCLYAQFFDIDCDRKA